MKILIKSTATLITITLITINFSLAQTPPPPPGDPSSGGGPVGGGAAIGSGIAILLALGAGYGAKKVYDYRKRKLAE